MLFEPLALANGKVCRNRIWLAPLTNMQSHPDGKLSDDELHFLAMRADGGFGLVETCAAHVAQDGKAWAGELSIASDDMLPGLTRLAHRIGQGGALASAQLFHGGIRAVTAVSGLPTWSANAHVENGIETCRAGTEADIIGAIKAFADAAQRCQRAGFDSVEIHGAHGYLLSQFLSTAYNSRTDQWGGDLAGRARLIRQVTQAVKRAAPQLALAVRISPEDYGQSKGLDLDESVQVAKWLVDDGMEILHLSVWQYENNTAKRPDVHPITVFRQALGKDVKIVIAGKIWTRADADKCLSLGADAVALGRSAIANPNWPLLVQDEQPIAMPPLTVAQLQERGLNQTFATYMKRWPGFVVDGTPPPAL
jgi:2,4-dienoyl-CoA reductase-like NADH-dependent reductase (Old Yellow Enzyme family)